ncbi:MAG: protein-glutamate O-methyltransferase CheR [Thermoplasmata archaeon]|nr:protein-glutamate O-methyltransferase CheR [Thermoplasmata archaeon]
MNILIADDDASFNALKRMIFEHTNLDCSQYKDKYLKRRLQVRLRANELDNYADYIRYLKKNHGEYDTLMDMVTINVTQFFRDPSMFKVLGNEVIPEIIYNKTNSNRRVFRIWSAGSSSGEEAYSIAIIIKELLGERFDDFLVSVHGTDIDDGSLIKAKIGAYPIDQLENVSEALLDHYFDYNNDDDIYMIKDEIKDFVRFKKHNLIQDKKSVNFDMIFNRNVMIYFSREMQEKLLMDFYDSLNNGGYLVIGKTEMLSGEAKNVFVPVNNRERIYIKEKD